MELRDGDPVPIDSSHVDFINPVCFAINSFNNDLSDYYFGFW
jgi:hypothetical protein